MSAAFSATATTGAAGWPLSWFGKTDASTTRRPLTPNTRRRGSTTPISGDAPMRAVDVCTVNICMHELFNLLSSPLSTSRRMYMRGRKEAAYRVERCTAVGKDVFLDFLVCDLHIPRDGK